MKINSLKYFLKEATKNVFTNGWMSLASAFTVIASLLVFGLFLILALNLNYMVTQVESDYEITLTIDEFIRPVVYLILGFIDVSIGYYFKKFEEE